MALVWTEAMRTGSVEIDFQHRELIRQVESLHEAMRQGRGQEEFARTLDFMAQYVARHFAAEEALMERVQCPAAEENKKAHRQLVERLAQLRSKFDQEGTKTTALREMYQELSKWLANHICKVDAQLRPCLEPHAAACAESR
jgi:hemerythrin-like metal-binding protein